MRGADKGPDAILEASVNLEFYDIETSSEAHLKGINTVDPVLEKETPGKLVDAVYDKDHCLFLTDNKFPVIIGGNHTVPIGAMKAFSEYFEIFPFFSSMLMLICGRTYEGSEFNHACAMARAREFAPIVQVGIRSMSAEGTSLC